MIKNYTLIAFALILSLSVFAKQRNVDMSARMLAPTVGTTIKSGQNFNFQISMKNEGVDTLKTNDTLYLFVQVDGALDTFKYNNSTSYIYGLILFPSQKVAPGDSIVTALSNIALAYPNSFYGNHDVCGFVMPVNATDTLNDANIFNNQGCSNLKFDTTAKPNGIQSLAGNNGFSIYPNPAKNKLVITNAINNTKSIEVIDLLGKVVMTSLMEDSSMTLNIETLNNGVYFVRIISKNGVIETKKFVKE